MSAIFETEPNSYKTDPENHRKKLVLIAISAILVIVVTIFALKYVTDPKHGDKVDAPIGLEKAIEQYLGKKIPGIKIAKITYHYCEFIKFKDSAAPLKNYVALVEMESVRFDMDNPTTAILSMASKYQKVFVLEKPGERSFESFASSTEKFLTDTHPCEVAKYSRLDH